MTTNNRLPLTTNWCWGDIYHHPPIQLGVEDDTPVSIYVQNKSTMVLIMLRLSLMRLIFVA